MLAMKIVLPNERPMSWNDFYSNKHWSRRAAEAKRVHELLWYAIPYHQKKIFTERVSIFMVAYFKDHPQDSSNICVKLYEDGLKNILIKDDSRQYVGFVITRSEVDLKHPRVELTIVPDSELKIQFMKSTYSFFSS
jgi:hypothetical protein